MGLFSTYSRRFTPEPQCYWEGYMFWGTAVLDGDAFPSLTEQGDPDLFICKLL